MTPPTVDPKLVQGVLQRLSTHMGAISFSNTIALSQRQAVALQERAIERAIDGLRAAADAAETAMISRRLDAETAGGQAR